MSLIVVISFVFYFSDLFLHYSTNLTGLDVNQPRHLILHNFAVENGEYRFSENLPRNSSFFWEPGAFGAILLLALYFNRYNNSKNAITQSVILILGIISTQSTMAYFGLVLFVLYWLRSYLNSRFLIPFVFFVYLFLFFGWDLIVFNVDKLFSQYSELKDIDFDLTRKSTAYSSRFGNILLLKDAFFESPLFGNGLYLSIKYRNFLNVVDAGFIGIGNGLMDFIVSFGLVFYLLYFIVLFKKISILNDLGESFFLFVLLNVLVFSEPIHNFWIFWVFLFLQYSNYLNE